MQRSRLFSNITYMVLMQGTNYLVPLLIIPVLLNKIGLASYGLIAMSQGIIFIMAAFADFGLNITGTRLISQLTGSGKSLHAQIAEIISAKSIMTVLSFLLLLVATELIPVWNQHQQLILYSFPMVIGINFFPHWYFEGIQRMSPSLFLNAGSRLLYFVSVLWFIKSPDDLIWVNTVNGLSMMIVACIAWAMIIRKQQTYRLFISSRSIRLLANNWRIFLSNLVVDTYKSIGIIIAGLLFAPSALGLFGILDKLIALIHNVYGAIYRALFPEVALQSQASEKRLLRLSRNYYVTFGLLTAAGSLALFFFLEHLVPFVTDDVDVSEIKPFLGLLALIPFGFYASLPFSLVLIAFDYKSRFLVYNLATLFGFLIFISLTIERHGISALLVGHLFAQVIAFVTGLILVLLIYKERRTKLDR
jgi:PST family polysaccharide transporter